MKTFLVVALFIVCLVMLGEWFWSAPTTDVAEAAPIVTPTPLPTFTPTPTSVPAPTLSQLGTPIRIQFARGSYGQSVSAVKGQTTYVLWAKQGQMLKLTSDKAFASRLTTKGGADVVLTGDSATLPTSGDYLLTVEGAEAFVYYVDIR